LIDRSFPKWLGYLVIAGGDSDCDRRYRNGLHLIYKM
jgi:hypothetical protein